MHTEIHNQAEKLLCAWGTICASQALDFLGITSWSAFAAFVGSMYTLLLLAEWFWKRLWRPVLVRWGFVKRQGMEDAR